MRKPRIKVQGTPAVYHCIARIVGGQSLLGDMEKEQLRIMLWQQSEFCGIEVITYCMMINHFHLLTRVPASIELTDQELLEKVRSFYGPKSNPYLNLRQSFEEQGHLTDEQRAPFLSRMGDLSVFMKELKQCFSLWYNHLHDRFGTLWAERFRSQLIEDHSQALRLTAMYIDLNPVRAGIVQDPKDYRFCGYAEAVAGGKRAQNGLQTCMSGCSWDEISTDYRQALLVQSADPGHSAKQFLTKEEILKKLEKGASLQTAEVLRLSIRYMIDGLVLGSKTYVNRIFATFPGHFGPHRKDGARRPRALGRALGDLYVARDLKVSVIG